MKDNTQVINNTGDADGDNTTTTTTTPLPHTEHLDEAAVVIDCGASKKPLLCPPHSSVVNKVSTDVKIFEKTTSNQNKKDLVAIQDGEINVVVKQQLDTNDSSLHERDNKKENEIIIPLQENRLHQHPSNDDQHDHKASIEDDSQTNYSSQASSIPGDSPTEVQVKIADFGLARIVPYPVRPLTREVVTLWYRAPEILMGCPDYTPAVDIWAVGCVFAELLFGRAIFPGDVEIDTLFKIFQLLGTPDEQTWSGISKLPYYKPVWPQWKRRPDRFDYFRPQLDDNAKDLLDKFFTYDHQKRITAAEALEHPWFKSYHHHPTNHRSKLKRCSKQNERTKKK